MSSIDNIEKQMNKIENLNEISSNSGVLSIIKYSPINTDNIKTKDIVEFISYRLSKIIENNKKQKLKPLKGKNEPLYSIKIPKLTIENFLIRIIKYTEAENMTLLLAYDYIERLIEKENFIICLNNVYRLLLGSTVLAIKILEDNKYDNSEYCQIGGLSLKDFNAVEYSLAVRLDFELNPSYEDIESILEQIYYTVLSKQSRNQSLDSVSTNL